MNYCRLKLSAFELITAKHSLIPVTKKPVIFCYDYCSHIFTNDFVDVHPEKTIEIIYCIFCEKTILTLY
jgi:hypothetical protein